jgi:hypothetical protein
MNIRNRIVLSNSDGNQTRMVREVTCHALKIYITVDLSEFLNAATGIGCCFRHAAAMVRG